MNKDRAALVVLGCSVLLLHLAPWAALHGVNVDFGKTGAGLTYYFVKETQAYAADWSFVPSDARQSHVQAFLAVHVSTILASMGIIIWSCRWRSGFVRASALLGMSATTAITLRLYFHSGLSSQARGKLLTHDPWSLVSVGPWLIGVALALSALHSALSNEQPRRLASGLHLAFAFASVTIALTCSGDSEPGGYSILWGLKVVNCAFAVVVARCEAGFAASEEPVGATQQIGGNVGPAARS